MAEDHQGEAPGGRPYALAGLIGRVENIDRYSAAAARRTGKGQRDIAKLINNRPGSLAIGFSST